MEKLIKEPLLHFLLIGALLFVIFDYLNEEPEPQLKVINVTRTDIENLTNNFLNTWQRPPTKQELNQLIEEKVRDDITYQEALSLGLQKEDIYIKRRLRMKLESLYIDLSARNEPTQPELESYLKRHAIDFAIDSQLAFSQVYFSPTNNSKEQLDKQIEALKNQLNQNDLQVDIEQLGDSTLLASHYPMMSVKNVHNQFGKAFADSIDALKIGKWTGPIRSQYGYHLVKVEQRIPSYVPDLSEVRLTVERGVISERRQQLLDSHYQRLRDQYSVNIDNSDDQEATP